MSFFILNEEKCKRCRICLKECPIGIILMDSETGYPKLRTGSESNCILCGHCVAVCPHTAVNLAPLPEDGFIPANKQGKISFAEADDFLKSRRSIRSFKASPLTREELEQIMDVARFAPTATNKQALCWLMIKDPSTTNKIAELVIDWMSIVRKENPEVAKKRGMAGLIAAWRKGEDMILRGAPHLAIAYTKEDSPWYAIDAAIALTYVELSAHALGVGACWAGFFTHAANTYKPLQDFLGLPEGSKVYGGQMLGRPLFNYSRLPWRKPLEISWV